MSAEGFDPLQGLAQIGEIVRVTAIPIAREEIATAGLKVIVETLGAAGGAVYQIEEDGALRALASQGRSLASDPEAAERRARAALESPVPADDVSDGSPDWIAAPVSSASGHAGVLLLQTPGRWSPSARIFLRCASQALAMALAAVAKLAVSREQGELLAQRNTELEALRELAGRLQDLTTEEQVLQAALDIVLEKMALASGWIFWGETVRGRLELAAARGISDEFVTRARTSGIGTCLCLDVFETGTLRFARNTVDCPRLPELVCGKEMMAHACIPLKFERGTLGVMNIANRPGELFTPAELQFLEIVGNQVCLAVDKVRTGRAEHRRNAVARALVSLSKAIGGSLELDKVLAAVGEFARELLTVDRCAVFLGNDPARLEFAYLSGPEFEGLAVGGRADIAAIGSRGILEVLNGRKTLVVNDAETDLRVNPELARRWGARSGVIVPLVAHGHLEGVLLACREQASQWTEEEIALADALGRQAAMAMENARLYREAQEALLHLQEAQYGMMRAERLAAVGTLASSLAHEVRNPLNSINLQLVILSRRIDRMDAPLQGEVTKLVETARGEIVRLNDLVQEFLSLSSIDRIVRAPVEPAEVVREVVQLMTPVAKERSVSLVEELGGQLPRVSLDREKIKQVLINLVRNAIEAMPDGGSVRISLRRSAGSMLIAIADSGGGIEPGLDVFDFFMTTKRGGTGLGLPIALRIVEAHGGTLTYESEPGRGTIFYLTLPAE